MTIETYRGYGIDYNVYNMKEYSVQWCGDDFLFWSLDEARAFIDESVDDWDNRD